MAFGVCWKEYRKGFKLLLPTAAHISFKRFYRFHYPYYIALRERRTFDIASFCFISIDASWQAEWRANTTTSMLMAAL